MAVRQIAGTTCQHLERAVEPVEQLLAREQICPHRCQLDGKGQAVEPPADAADRGGVGLGEPEVALHGSSSLDEQLYGRRVTERPGVLAFTRRERERRDSELLLDGQAERCPARD